MSQRIRTGLRAGILAGLAGNVTISLYLGLTLPLFFGIPAIALFQWDASNIVGAGAFEGGVPLALLGFLFDCIVASCWGVAWAFMTQALPALRRPPFLWGLLYGVLVMLVMQDLVVPLGRADHPPHALPQEANLVVAHTLFFGVPVAWFVRALARASN